MEKREWQRCSRVSG